MAVFKMLSEVICAIEFFARVALPELMSFLQMLQSHVPITLSCVPCTCSSPTAHKFFTAIAAGIGLAGPVLTFVKSSVKPGHEKCRTGPAMASDVQTILVAFSLVLVLETITTERALVLFLSFMCTK
ncbi:hypothetical protein RRF57_004944 [Xylaria bambusicola]|uniref:Uncharacterized protein n=1 Tax=Xylaria bambusicola TaxID=326684 RepID=A0AAN7UJE6_9PEZI